MARSRRDPVFAEPGAPFWTGGATRITRCSTCDERLPVPHHAGARARMNLPNEVEILLVEDNPHDEELTLRALKERNIANQLFVARDGAEALDFFFGDGTHPWREIGIVPRVVLLDLKLPKVDGLEVLRRLKADERTRALPVVVLTSSRDRKSTRLNSSHGYISYAVKPADFESFARA